MKYEPDNTETRKKFIRISYLLLLVAFVLKFVIPLAYFLACFSGNELFASTLSYITHYFYQDITISTYFENVSFLYYLGFSMFILPIVSFIRKPFPDYYKDKDDCLDTFSLFRNSLCLTLAMTFFIFILSFYINPKEIFSGIYSDPNIFFILFFFFVITLLVPLIFIVLVIKKEVSISRVRPYLAIGIPIIFKLYMLFSDYGTGSGVYSSLSYIPDVNYETLVWLYNLLYLLLILSFAGMSVSGIARILYIVGGISLFLMFMFYVYYPAIYLAAYYMHCSGDIILSIVLFVLAFASYSLVIGGLVLIFIGGSFRAKYYLFLNILILSSYTDLYLYEVPIPSGNVLLLAIVGISQVFAFLGSRKVRASSVSEDTTTE